MRFLVTGATGFIGTHLCRRLLQDGHELIALVRSASKIAPDLEGRLEVLAGDLSIFDDPNRVLPQADVVVHLAAVIAGDNQQQYADINFVAVERMLTVVRNQTWKPRRFLFASSLAAAGPSNGRTLTEDDTAAPVDAYGRAKLAAEALMTKQPFPTTTFRPSLVLGAGDSATLTLFKMVRSGFAVLPGFREQPLSVIDVSEVVDALSLMANATDDDHHLYFLTSGIETTNTKLLRSIGSVMQRSVFILRLPSALIFVAMLFSTLGAKLLRMRNQLDLKQYQQITAPGFLCSSERLQRELSWQPKKPMTETLQDAVAGYTAQGQL